MQTRAELEDLALVEVDLTKLERMVEEIGLRLKVKLEQNYGSTSDISNPSRLSSNKERKSYVYRITTRVLVTAVFSPYSYNLRLLIASILIKFCCSRPFILYVCTCPFGTLTVSITIFCVFFFLLDCLFSMVIKFYSSWAIFLTGNIRQMPKVLPHHNLKGQ